MRRLILALVLTVPALGCRDAAGEGKKAPMKMEDVPPEVMKAAKEKLPHRIFLFYLNRRPEDAPFLEELQILERENSNYKLIASMTEMEKRG